MKKFLMLYLMIVSSIPSFAANIVAEVTPVDERISSIQMDHSGLLSVMVSGKPPSTLQLSESNKRDLLRAADLLSRVELKNDKRTLFCKMIPEVSDMQTLNVYDPSTQSMRSVLTSASCTQAVYTHPEDSDLIAAAVLKAQLIVLGQQAHVNKKDQLKLNFDERI